MLKKGINMYRFSKYLTRADVGPVLPHKRIEAIFFCEFTEEYLSIDVILPMALGYLFLVCHPFER